MAAVTVFDQLLYLVAFACCLFTRHPVTSGGRGLSLLNTLIITSQRVNGMYETNPPQRGSRHIAAKRYHNQKYCPEVMSEEEETDER